jgi:hypothetical protein
MNSELLMLRLSHSCLGGQTRYRHRKDVCIDVRNFGPLWISTFFFCPAIAANLVTSPIFCLRLDSSMLIDSSDGLFAFGKYRTVDVPSKLRMNFGGHCCRSPELVSYENFG